MASIRRMQVFSGCVTALINHFKRVVASINFASKYLHMRPSMKSATTLWQKIKPCQLALDKVFMNVGQTRTRFGKQFVYVMRVLET